MNIFLINNNIYNKTAPRQPENNDKVKSIGKLASYEKNVKSSVKLELLKSPN